jgi:hypothetical protein
MDDDNDHKLVAVIGTGLLSSFFDSPADIRAPLTLSDSQFDRMVRGLFDEGRIATDAVENGYIH